MERLSLYNPEIPVHLSRRNTAHKPTREVTFEKPGFSPALCRISQKSAGEPLITNPIYHFGNSQL